MKTKHLLLILFLALITSANAQLKYESYNLADARQLADSIALNAKYPFEFASEGSAKHSENVYCFKYQNKEDSEEYMIVFFYKRMEGENKDLEIEGTPKYTFNVVYGRFLNLFPFWKKFIAPEADAEKITTGSRYHNIQKGDHKFTLQRQKDKWGIKMW